MDTTITSKKKEKSSIWFKSIIHKTAKGCETNNAENKSERTKKMMEWFRNHSRFKNSKNKNKTNSGLPSLSSSTSVNEQKSFNKFAKLRPKLRPSLSTDERILNLCHNKQNEPSLSTHEKSLNKIAKPLRPSLSSIKIAKSTYKKRKPYLVFAASAGDGKTKQLTDRAAALANKSENKCCTEMSDLHPCASKWRELNKNNKCDTITMALEAASKCESINFCISCRRIEFILSNLKPDTTEDSKIAAFVSELPGYSHVGLSKDFRHLQIFHKKYNHKQFQTFDNDSNNFDYSDTKSLIKYITKTLSKYAYKGMNLDDMKIQTTNNNNDNNKIDILQAVSKLMMQLQTKKDFNNKYMKLGLISKGANGKIYAIKAWTKQDKFYAMKEIHFKKLNPNILYEVLRNWLMVTELKLLGNETEIFVDSNKSTILIVQHLYKGSMCELLKETYLKKRRCLTENELKIILKNGILDTLKIMHDVGYIHGDLKPENLVYETNNKNEYKTAIIDYDLCITCGNNGNEVLSECRGTLGYSAPEWTPYKGIKSIITSKVDIYSLGLTMLILLCGEQPFYVPQAVIQHLEKEDPTINIKQFVHQTMINNGQYMISHFLNQLSNKISKELFELLTIMLKHNVNERADIHQVINHKWFVNTSTDEKRTVADKIGLEDQKCNLQNLVTTHSRSGNGNSQKSSGRENKQNNNNSKSSNNEQQDMPNEDSSLPQNYHNDGSGDDGKNNKNNDKNDDKNNDKKNDKNKSDAKDEVDDKQDNDAKSLKPKITLKRKQLNEQLKDRVRIQQYEKLIWQHETTIEEHKKTIQQRDVTIHQQKQIIASLQKSHQSLVSLVQHLTATRSNSKSNPTPKKPKKVKLKQMTESMQYHTPESQFKMPINLTAKIAPNMITEKIEDMFNYMKDSIQLQINDHEIEVCDDSKDDIIINFDFHGKDKESLYGIAVKQKYKWEVQRLLTTKEIEQQYKSKLFHLPESSRFKLRNEMSAVNKVTSSLVSKLQKAAVKCKWQDVIVFGRKDNQERVILSLTPKQFREKLQKCIVQRNYGSNIVPIIMMDVNKNSHQLEYLFIAQIEDDIYIGISFLLKKNKLHISSIHLDKDYIIRQHHFALPQHASVCKCMNKWQSRITDLTIYGNLDEPQNKIDNYKGRYEKLKNSLHNVINEVKIDDENINQLKLHAEIMIKCDNGLLLTNKQQKSNDSLPRLTLCNSSSLGSSISTISPQMHSPSFGMIQDNIQLSMDSFNSMNSYSYNNSATILTIISPNNQFITYNFPSNNLNTLGFSAQVQPYVYNPTYCNNIPHPYQ